MFIAVNPDEIPNVRYGRRGRISYPIVKGFLETGLPVAKLDRTKMNYKIQNLQSTLNAYIRTHELPIKLVVRSGEIYLIRTDLDNEGNAITPEPTEKELARQEPPEELNADLVSAMYLQEKGQQTK